MEDTGCRIKADILIRDDAGVLPSLTFHIIDHQHMVSKDRTKAKFIPIWFLFRMSSFGDFDIHKMDPLSKRNDYQN